MSGSGGGYTGGGGGWGNASPSLNCGNVSFSVVLSSPQANAITALQKGTVLQVSIHEGVVVCVNGGQVVGSINWAMIGELIRCMEEGFQYIATVVSVDDGRVKVNVTSEA